MPQRNYSFLGSPLLLFLEEEIAEGYNRFIDALMEAQRLFKEEYGIQWTPDLPLQPKASPEDNDAYNKVGSVINLLVEINGGALDIHEDQCPSEHLIAV